MSKDWTGDSHSVWGCLGASNHCKDEREENDYYATDPVAGEWLINLEHLHHNIWECACGEGHLSKVFLNHGFNVKSTDLIDRGFGDGGIDFLKCKEKFDGDIITNPPYKYAKEFIEHALSLVDDGNKVCMFLKVQFLEGKSRKKMFAIYPPPNSMDIVKQNCMYKEWNRSGKCNSGLCMVCMGEGLQRRHNSKMVQLRRRILDENY